MFNHHDITRDEFMLHGPLTHHGYGWWWHSFTAQDAETGEDKPFFIEFSSAIRRWQRISLSWDSCRRTRLRERSRPT